MVVKADNQEQGQTLTPPSVDSLDRDVSPNASDTICKWMGFGLVAGMGVFSADHCR